MTPIRFHIRENVLQLVTCIMLYLPAFDLLEYDFQVAFWINSIFSCSKDAEHLIKRRPGFIVNEQLVQKDRMFRVLVACTLKAMEELVRNIFDIG